MKPQGESIYTDADFIEYKSISIADNKESPPRNADLSGIIRQIREGSNGLKTKIEKLNNLYLTDPAEKKEKYNALKDTLPVFMASGIFTGSKHAKSLQQHSGNIILDFDHMQDAQEFKSQVCKDSHTHTAFLSPSANGVKVICKVNPIPNNPYEHKEQAWKAVAKYYEKYGIAEEGTDGSGKNVNRLCYLSYDPNVYYNPQSEPLSWEYTKQEKKKEKAYTNSDTDVDLSVLDFIDPDSDYESWLNVGMAIHDQGLDFSVFDNWSSKGAKYKVGETETKWKSFTANGGITWATVVSLAKENGYKPKSDKSDKSKSKSEKQPDLTLPEDRFFQKGRGFNVRQMITELTQKNDYICYAEDIYRYQKGVYKQDDKFNKRVRKLLNTRQGVSRVNETRAAFQDEFNTDLTDSRHLINFQNGLLDINTLELLPHTPDYKTVTQYPVAWNPVDPKFSNCDKNKVCQLLLELVNDNSVFTLMEAIGSIFHNASTDMQTGFILTGAGSNGKSTLLKIIEKIVGKENICNTNWGDFESKPYSAHSLVGKSLALNEDFTNSSKLGGVVKHAVTGGTINARQIYEKAFDFTPQATWIMACNDLPSSSDTSYGFYRRWIIISFPKRFEKNQQKGNQVIRECTGTSEKESFVSLCVQAYRDAWKRGSYTEPDCHKENMEMYKSVSSPILAWISENTEQDDNSIENRTAFFENYLRWCEDNNQKPLSAQRFYAELKNHGWDIDAKPQRYEGERMRAIKGRKLI